MIATVEKVAVVKAADAMAEVAALFLRLLPHEFFGQVRGNLDLRRNRCVYTDCVVMWLMITQRWQGNGTLVSGVLEMLRGLSLSFWAEPCARLRVGPDGKRRRLSSNTGSYNEARQRLPAGVVEACCEEVSKRLIEAMPPGRRVYFVDGTSVRTPNRPALSQMYPPASNQHQESHWPVIRLLVAHDVETALALRPAWGPMYGPQAVSEQALLEQVIERVPGDAILLGDCNFGVFSVAYAATRRKHPVVLRMTPVRAKSMAGQELKDGLTKTITWRPSRSDQRAHPELSADACVPGRLIAQQVQPSDGSKPFLLTLFTTLPDSDEEVIQLYGKRYSIELDLRTLKSTLQLEQLTSTSPQMVAKEIEIAMLAYNLVRAIICTAAAKAGLGPRQFSFTRVQKVIEAFTPLIAAAAAAGDAALSEELLEKMMYYVGQAKLPKRNRKKNSYQRAAWGRPRVYPKPSK